MAASDNDAVGNNLDGLTVSFELKQVTHDGSGSLGKLRLAEVNKLVEPNLANAQLNLLEGEVFHDITDELGVNLSILIGGNSLGNLVEELSEVVSNGQIDEHVLVETGVVVTFDWVDILELLEPAERVASAHQLRESSV